MAVQTLNFYPEITVILAVKSSGEQLYRSVRSVANSTYPRDKVLLYLVENKTGAEGFRELEHCQHSFPQLRMQLLNARAGETAALRAALRSASGRYIFRMDSDGELEPHALARMVAKFEEREDILCQTGVVLPSPAKIQGIRGAFSRFLGYQEYMEHGRSFLFGCRSMEENHRVYEMTGAFSAVRKSAAYSCLQYHRKKNNDELTVRDVLHRTRVSVCREAFLLTSPRESGKRAEERPRFLKDFSPLLLLLWLAVFAFMICPWNPLSVPASIGVLYGALVIWEVICSVVVSRRLREQPGLRRYYRKGRMGLLVLPIYRICLCCSSLMRRRKRMN